MIKYRLQKSDGFAEYLTQPAAEAAALEYGISDPSITEIEFTPRVKVTEISQAYTVLRTPGIVSPRQIRLALLAHGITPTDINTALNSLEEPAKTAALVEWRYASELSRENPLVASVGSMLGWTAEQLDDLWIEAIAL